MKTGGQVEVLDSGTGSKMIVSVLPNECSVDKLTWSRDREFRVFEDELLGVSELCDVLGEVIGVMVL